MAEMAKPASGPKLVAISRLVEFIARSLAATGVPPEDAVQVAALMAESDARGGDAHGVFRLPQYVKQIQQGAVNPRPHIRVVNNRAGTALIRRRQRSWPSGDEARDGTRHRKSAAMRDWLGGNEAQQSRRPRAAVSANGGAAGHDWNLFLRGQHKPCSAVGRHRSAAQHESHRHRRSGIKTSIDRAGHGYDEHCIWENSTEGATRRAHAGGLDD